MILAQRAKAFPRWISPIASVLAVIGFASALSACTTMQRDDARAAAERYRSAIESPVRTDQDRRMDAARHPAQFLPFTQVRPGMQVLDVAAGAGYTSQLLALAVGPEGMVWAQSQQPGATLTKRKGEHPQANLVVVGGRSTIQCPIRRLSSI